MDESLDQFQSTTLRSILNSKTKMNKIIMALSCFMAGVMSFFSPMTVNHGETSCCAECVFKREEEVEVVYEEEDNIGGND